MKTTREPVATTLGRSRPSLASATLGLLSGGRSRPSLASATLGLLSGAAPLVALALASPGALAAPPYVVAPDSSIMMSTEVGDLDPPGPFPDCSTTAKWWQLFALHVSDLANLRLHATLYSQCLNTAGSITYDASQIYGGSAPTIVDEGTRYRVTWNTSLYSGGNWVPGGTFWLYVEK